MEINEIIEKQDIKALDDYLEENNLKMGPQRRIASMISKSTWDVSLFKDYNERMRWYWFNINLLRTKSYDESMTFIDDNLSYFHSWWSVDGTLMNIKRKGLTFEKVYCYAKKYVKDKREFVCRFGYCSFLMCEMSSKNIYKIEKLLKDDDRYYIQMMEAWLICEMITKNNETGFEILERSKLKYNILGKAIQKCLDSFRISDEYKERIKALREEKRQYI